MTHLESKLREMLIRERARYNRLLDFATANHNDRPSINYITYAESEITREITRELSALENQTAPSEQDKP